MLTVTAKQIRGLLLLAIALLGLALGYALAQISGWFLADTAGEKPAADVAASRPAAAERVDVDAILRGNLFDPSARGSAAKQPAPATTRSARPVQAVNLRLHGTVDGGEDPLALIEAAGKVQVFRPGDALPGGGELLSIERSRVLIRQNDGLEAELIFEESTRRAASPRATAAASRAQARPAPGSGIRDLGGNRWEISQDEVDRARSNLGNLLKQARMEPHVVNGQTEGFVVRMIRPRSMLANLGMKVGDVVSAVNGVALDSPEKALQIFQQLREAKRLTVDLTRGGEPMTFEYQVN